MHKLALGLKGILIWTSPRLKNKPCRLLGVGHAVLQKEQRIVFSIQSVPCDYYEWEGFFIIMAISFWLWIFYFTGTLRKWILHKIIMNWYELLLINMDDVLFCELKTSKDRNVFNRPWVSHLQVLIYLPQLEVLGEVDVILEVIWPLWFRQWLSVEELCRV